MFTLNVDHLVIEHHFLFIEINKCLKFLTKIGEFITSKLGERFQPSEHSIEFGNSIYVPNATSSPRSWLVKVHGNYNNNLC